MDGHNRSVRIAARLLAGVAVAQFIAATAGLAADDDLKACLSRSDERSAIHACSRVISSNRVQGKELARTHYGRGIKHRNHRENDHAIADFTKAIELDPNWPWPYVARGHAYSAQKRFAMAFADQETAIRLEPTAVTYTGRGRSLMEAGAYQRALVDFGEALRIDPGYFAGYYWRGETYRKLREFSKAEADFRKALEIRPDDESAKRGLTRVRQGLAD